MDYEDMNDTLLCSYGCERILHFKKCGYDTLVIWDKELKKKNRKSLIKKIIDFYHNNKIF